MTCSKPTIRAGAAEDEIHAVGKPCPGVRVAGRAGQGNLAGLEVNHTVIWKIVAKQADAAGVVGPVSQPDEPVGADAEELGAIVVAVFDAETKPRGRAADFPTGHVQAALFGERG